jgi:hypothetical protein
MVTRKLYLLTALFAFAAVLTFSSCSSDDDNGPTDPNAGLHQLYIDFRPGDTFLYDRYELDENNQPVAATKHDYQVQMIKGTSSLAGYDDWFNRLGRDMVSNEKDTMFVRAENITRSDGSAYTKELWVYGLRHQILQSFVQVMQENLGTNAPTIPSAEWDVVGKYYDGSGKALDVGTEWNLTPDEGDELNFNVGPTPIRIVAKIKAKYAAREEKMTVNDKEVKTWKTTVTGAFTLTSFNLTLDLVLHLWMSDDPDGPIKMVQESMNLYMPPLPAVSEPGDMMTVKDWF